MSKKVQLILNVLLILGCLASIFSIDGGRWVTEFLKMSKEHTVCTQIALEGSPNWEDINLTKLAYTSAVDGGHSEKASVCP